MFAVGDVVDNGIILAAVIRKLEYQEDIGGAHQQNDDTQESNIFVRIEKWTPDNEFRNPTSHFGRNCLRRIRRRFCRACFFFDHLPVLV